MAEQDLLSLSNISGLFFDKLPRVTYQGASILHQKCLLDGQRFRTSGGGPGGWREQNGLQKVGPEAGQTDGRQVGVRTRLVLSRDDGKQGMGWDPQLMS